jgi:hypothetical protein
VSTAEKNATEGLEGTEIGLNHRKLSNMSARNFGLTEGEIQELKKRPYPRFAPAPMQRLVSQAKVIWPFAVGWAVTLFLYSRIPITGTIFLYAPRTLLCSAFSPSFDVRTLN